MERLIVWQRWLPPADSSAEAVAQAALWRIAARERFGRDNAEVLMELGGSAAFALLPYQITRSIEHCLSLVQEFEGEEQDAGSVSFGLALGTVERTGNGTVIGDAVDRAQALAHMGAPFEIVLDPAVQTVASSSYLFGRRIEGPLSAEVIDRRYPRRGDCGRALLHLSKPALSATAQHQLATLQKLAASPGRHRVLLIGPYGAGASSWLRQIARDMDPCVWLDVRALSSSLAPLSGLMYALRRLPEAQSLERVLHAPDEPDRQSLAALQSVRAGGAVSRRDTIMALRQYLGRAHEQSGKRVLVTVNPGPLIDPATVGVMAEVTRDGGPDGLVVLRLPLDAKAPEAFARGGNLAEIRVPSLSQQEARAFALSMLGREPSTDIARRAAAMGGSLPLGVAEALRVLVASGDVVFDGQRFCWRHGPAGRVNTLSVEALLEERIDRLPQDARRMLETLALVPDPEETQVVHEVADAEGLRDSVREDAIEELVAASLLERNEYGLALSPVVRNVVLGGMSPDRASDLNRHLAAALERRIASDNAFSRATLAYHMARGGRVKEAIDIMLSVAHDCGQLGFFRSGVRLAAASVEFDPSSATRARAAELAEQFHERVMALRRSRADLGAPTAPQPEPPEANGTSPETPAPTNAEALSAQMLQQAVEAILARDFDAVERSLELATAAGRDAPSVDRLRAMPALVRGDRAGAVRLLDKTRGREAEQGHDSARNAIAMALVLLEAGDAHTAVREALRALALARAAGESAGEQAALATLSACYRRLGRDAEADTLAGLGMRAALPPAPVGGSSGA